MGLEHMEEPKEPEKMTRLLLRGNLALYGHTKDILV